MDNYIEASAKEGTRRHRGGNPGPRTHNTGFQQKMPQVLLNNGSNKTELISLFVRFLKITRKKKERRELKVPTVQTERERKL